MTWMMMQMLDIYIYISIYIFAFDMFRMLQRMRSSKQKKPNFFVPSSQASFLFAEVLFLNAPRGRERASQAI